MPFLSDDAAQFVIHPTFEIRTRYERRFEKDFDSHASDGRVDFLTRVRPGLQIEFGKEWFVELQYQYSHDLAWTPARNFSTENSDAALAYVQYRGDGMKLTAGRQRIGVGSQRLIGISDWGNVNKSQDGVRFQKGPWDIFGFEPAIALAAPINTRFYGAAYAWDGGLSMAVLKMDKTAAVETNFWTLNHLWTAKRMGWDLEAEGAIQSGEVLDKDILAWGWHAKASTPVGPTTKFFAEANAASGGGDDDTIRTFDQLNPSTHSKYGTMDLQGWRNMNEFALGLEGKPTKEWAWHASFHWFSLRDAGDAWYSDGGSPNGGFTDPTGKAGRDIGTETDLEATFKPTSRSTFGGGIGFFNPGRHIRDMKGGHADLQTYGYLYFQFKY
jgi:hypothetical protein